MNTALLRRFILYLIMLTIFITAAGWILFQTILKDQYFKGFLLLPLFFFSITLAVHIHLLKISRKDIVKFTPRFIGITGIKMVIYFALIAVYLIIDRHHSVSFLVSFMICYFIYTTFELLSVLKYLKNSK